MKIKLKKNKNKNSKNTKKLISLLEIRLPNLFYRVNSKLDNLINVVLTKSNNDCVKEITRPVLQSK